MLCSHSKIVVVVFFYSLVLISKGSDIQGAPRNMTSNVFLL